MNEELIAELKGYFETIRTIEKDITEDIQACNDYLIDLTTIQARANFLMAEYGKKLREEKKTSISDIVGFQRGAGEVFRSFPGKRLCQQPLPRDRLHLRFERKIKQIDNTHDRCNEDDHFIFKIRKRPCNIPVR